MEVNEKSTFFENCAESEITKFQPHWPVVETLILQSALKTRPSSAVVLVNEQKKEIDSVKRKINCSINWKEEITFSRLGTWVVNASFAFYGFFLCAQTVSFSELHAHKYNKQAPKKTAPNCCFRWKPPISEKPALILPFWLAKLDLKHVTDSHMTDVNNLETSLWFLANHKRVDPISGNPLNTVLSRVFSLPNPLLSVLIAS